LTFHQAYRSDRLADSGCKRLFDIREKLGWKIVAEEMDPLLSQQNQ